MNGTRWTPRQILRSTAILLVATTILLSSAALAAGPKVYGIELVPYSREVGPDRFQSSRDWAGTIKYFKKKFAGWKYIRWHSVVNLPSVKYVHIENTYPKRQFDGLNVYVLPGGRVRMFMIKHVDEPKAPAKSEAGATGDKPGGKTDGPPKTQATPAGG